MTSLQWLALTALLTALFWVPYILQRIIALGLKGALWPVDPADELKQAVWALRCKRAHYNAVENLVVFATLVLVAAAMGKADSATVLMWTQVYFWSRVVHFPAMTLGLPVLRTLAFFGGFIAQVAVALEVLR